MKAIVFFVLFAIFGCAYCRSLPVQPSDIKVETINGNPVPLVRKARQLGNISEDVLQNGSILLYSPLTGYGNYGGGYGAYGGNYGGGYGGYGGYNNYDFNPYNDTPNNYDANPFNDSPHRQIYNNFDLNPFNNSPNNYDGNPFNNSAFFGKKQNFCSFAVLKSFS